MSGKEGLPVDKDPDFLWIRIQTSCDGRLMDLDGRMEGEKRERDRVKWTGPKPMADD